MFYVDIGMTVFRIQVAEGGGQMKRALDYIKWVSLRTLSFIRLRARLS